MSDGLGMEEAEVDEIVEEVTTHGKIRMHTWW